MEDLQGDPNQYLSNSKTAQLKKMLESGNSTLFSMEMSKNRNSDIVKSALDAYSMMMKQQQTFFKKCKIAYKPKFSEKEASDDQLRFLKQCF